MAREIPLLVVENAEIIFRNFSGRKERFNDEGKRYFNLVLDPDMAHHLEKEGWNISSLPARDEGEVDKLHTKIRVNFKFKPPKCYLVTSRGKTLITEAEVELLDMVEIENVDLVIRPREWDSKGSSGVAGYLVSIYIKIVEDPLDEKYGDIPFARQGDPLSEKYEEA